MRQAALFLWLALAGAAIRAGEESDPSELPPDPYDAVSLRSLMNAVTFRLSFDGGSMQPDMAAGPAWAPSVSGSYDKRFAAPQFEPGLCGEALVLGTGTGLYPGEGNLTLGRRGAVALWVKPLEWKRPNDGNVTFIIARGGLFYLQRQGPLQGEDGKKLRQEGIQYLAKRDAAQRRYTTLSGGIWENDRWYLLVANWSWPTMELSVNGGPFAVRALPGRPPDEAASGFIVGSIGGNRSLLDEILFFRRPLTVGETKGLYEALRPAATTDASQTP